MGTAVTQLIDRFSEQFGAGRDLAHVHAPARSEIAGNHTDHEGGHVVAGALDVSIEGVAALNGTMTARVASAGYEPFEIDLSDLSPREDEKVSTEIPKFFRIHIRHHIQKEVTLPAEFHRKAYIAG